MLSAMNAAGHLLLFWSIGLAVTACLVDQGPGLLRDHPPVARRWTGMSVGPVALLALISLACAGYGWLPALLAAPFSGVAVLYSLSWWRDIRADHRRATGRQVTIGGLITCIAFLLLAGPVNWHPGLVAAAFVASAAVLGGLVALFLKLASSKYNPLPVTPTGIPVKVVAVGLGVTLLAVLDLGLAALPLWPWLLLSLAVPVLLAAVAHWMLPRWQVPLCGTALLSALSGQALIHSLLLTFPAIPAPM